MLDFGFDVALDVLAATLYAVQFAVHEIADGIAHFLTRLRRNEQRNYRADDNTAQQRADTNSRFFHI